MRRVLCFLVLVGSLSIAHRASAGGLEYAGAGAESLGRGGAVTALADDPMVLSYNPAGLAELRGNQILLDMNYAFMSACMDPLGYYGWGAYGGGQASRLTGYGKTLDLNLGDGKPGPADAYYAGKLDTVCMTPNNLPVPQIGATWRVSERLGVGLGLMFPAATPQGQWGDPNGIIDTPNGLRPAPTRYMLINSGTLGVFPTIGIGYRIAKWLRIGAAFEWGVINVDNTNMAAASGGTSPAGDIIARVRAVDWFIPAVNASVHIVPTDSIDIVGAFRAQGDLDASGSVFLTTGLFDPRAKPTTTENKVESVHQKFPWKLRGAIRYADRLVPRRSGTGHDEGKSDFAEPIHDPMTDERWDVEFDLEYQMNSRNQEQDIRYAPMQGVAFTNVAGAITTTPFPTAPRAGASTDTIVKKAWKNQISARLGGSYNILPGFFSVSLGAHYENRGVDPSYMQLDYWPLSRVGLHAGVKLRVARTIDIVASYAHIFQETLIAGAPPPDTGSKISVRYAQTGEIDAIDKHSGTAPRGMEAPVLTEQAPSQVDGTAKLAQNLTRVVAGSPPVVINSGTYRSSIDVVAVGLHVHY
jgi:long-subunit fatty acid transport protein